MDAQSGLAARAVLTNAVTFKPDGRVVAFPSGGGWFFVAGPVNKPVVEGETKQGKGAIRISPNGRWAVQVLNVKQIKLWDTAAGRVQIVALADENGDPLKSVYYNTAPLDDGRVVVSDDMQAYVLRPGERGASRSFSVAARFAQAITPTTVALALDEEVQLHDVNTDDGGPRTRLPGESITWMASGEDGRDVFLATRSGGLWHWIPDAGEPPRRLARLGGAVVALAARRDGRLLAASAFSGSRDTTTYLIDVDNRRAFTVDHPETGTTFGLHLDRSGKRLALAASSPMAANVVSIGMSSDEACRAAGPGRLAPGRWTAAIGALAVAAPACTTVRR